MVVRERASLTKKKAVLGLAVMLSDGGTIDAPFSFYGRCANRKKPTPIVIWEKARVSLQKFGKLLIRWVVKNQRCALKT